MSVKKTAEKLGTTAEPEEEVNTNATQEEARGLPPAGQGSELAGPSNPRPHDSTAGGADQGDNDLLAAARAYAARGWFVFPCKPGKKGPLTNRGFKNASNHADIIAGWWQRWPDANIGIACGPSKLVVVDVDAKNDQSGLESWADLRAELGLNDETVTCETPTGGLHVYYEDADERDIRCSVGTLGEGLDVRAEGGYVLAPPSVHPDGGEYVWAMDCAPDEIEIVPLPASLAERLAKARRAPAAPVGDRIAQGGRNSTLASLAGTMRHRGMSQEAIEAALLVENVGRCDPPLAEAEVRKVAQSIARYEPGHVPTSAGWFCPPLPEYAQLTPEQVAEAGDAGAWLDEYVAFAAQASPMTPLAFHVAAGLATGSLAIARRLYLPVSTATNFIYPNVYILFVGPSTLPRKTTALRVLRGLLKEAGMQRFLLVERQTPEAFTMELTQEVPQSFDSWSEERREVWLEERAIAAQRGWLLEEASHLLDSFKRDYSRGLLPLVLDLYDCPAEGPRSNTMTRGREEIRNAYLTIFGATTHGAMATHLRNPLHWRNGLWARFALVCSDEVRDWQFWPEPLPYPEPLVQGLRTLATELLPMPKAALTEVDIAKSGKDAQPVKLVVMEEPLVSHRVQMSEWAWAQWERYARAVSFDMLRDESAILSKRLFASYGRLGTMTVKVAMILAAFDAEQLPVQVEGRHMYRAQTIVEEWRASLHQVMETAQVAENPDRARILQALASAETEWVSRRNLLRSLNATWSDLQPTVEDLVNSGEIESRATDRKGPPSMEYRLCA